jgi:hypothetical protein
LRGSGAPGREKNSFGRTGVDCSGGPLRGRDPLGWPEVIGRLTQERAQAETCVGMIKSTKKADAIAAAKATYEMAKPRIDGAIAGLIAALVEGGKPEAFPTVRDDLESSGQSLKKVCDATVKTVPPNTKGAEEAAASAVVEEAIKPIVDWLREKWVRLMEPDELERATKKSQLEAAKWPKFNYIHAQ